MGRCSFGGLVVALSVLALTMASGSAQAKDLVFGGKLKLTGGVASVEGSGGGGLASWALITGNETKDGIGAEASATYVGLPDYSLRAFGAGIGLFDRGEITIARQSFDTGGTGAKLGLGRGFTFDQTIVGAKLRVFGDALYDQDRWTPQLAIGVQAKSNDRGAVIHAVGGKADTGIDYYVAATKILLNESLVLNATVRATKANQFGLLGYGGDRSNGYSAQFEGSAGYLVSKRLLVGAELRTKPDNLGFAKEDDAYDLFVAVAVTRHLSVTAAYVDLGDIATFRHQRGVYVSLQAGF